MAYGTVKVDNITFDNGGSDQNVTVSGLYRATTSGVTLSGTVAATTVSGVTVIGSTTVSGATVTGTTANFTSGNFGNIISSAATMSGALIMANQQQVRFREAVGNGVNHIALQAPAIVSADQTITLPDQTGTVITTGDNGSVSSTMLATNLTISAAAGSASAPSIAFTGDTNTGIYSPGADQVAISTNGTERLRIDSSGNVGIGTSSPTQKLSVHGIASDTIDETTGVCKFQSDNGGNGLLFGTRASSPYQSYIQSAFVADTSVAQYSLLLNPLGGNVGINTTAPLSAFHIAATGECSLTIGNEQTNTDGLKRSAIIKKADNNLEIRATESTVASETIFTRTASVESARIDSSGRFGIGTSSPAQALHVLQSGGNNFAGIRTQNSNSGTGIAGLEFSSDATYAKAAVGLIRSDVNGVGSLVFYNASSTGAANWSTADERLRIDSSGNVGINTSTPTSKLEVIGSIKGVSASFGLFASNGSGTDQTSIGLRREGAPTDQKTWEILNGSTSGELVIRTISDSYASSQDAFSAYRGSGVGVDNVRLHTSGSERLRIDSSGNVGIGTSSPNYTLDLNSGGVTPAQIGTTVNWNFPGFILRRNASNVSTAKMLGMMLQGDTDSDTTLTNHLNIWGTYSAAPTTGSTTAGLSGVMNLGAPSGIALHVNGSERGRIDSSGNVGIGTSSPTTLLDVNADTIRVRTARTPASASATGATGEICWDANYIYVCTATNTWKRTAISTW